MFSADADGTKRKTSTHHRKVGWESHEPATYCCPAAEIMLSRPRSATPTMHDQIMRDRHRVSEEAYRAGNPSPRLQQAGGTTSKRQHEGRCERSRSSDHPRPIVQVVASSLT